MPDSRRQAIQAALEGFSPVELRRSSLAILNALGYPGDRTPGISDSPEEFKEFAKDKWPNFNEDKARFNEWKQASILFQLTDEDLSDRHATMLSKKFDAGRIQSYVFFAIELDGSRYSRTALFRCP